MLEFRVNKKNKKEQFGVEKEVFFFCSVNLLLCILWKILRFVIIGEIGMCSLSRIYLIFNPIQFVENEKRK